MSGVLHGVGSAAGLLLVSAEGVRIAEWRPNAADEVRRLDFGPLEEGRELRGPAPSHPRNAGEKATAFRSGQQRDLFERRLDEHRARFVREAAAEAAVLASERKWELVLVLGDPRLGSPAAEVLRSHGVETVQSAQVLEWLTPHELAQRVGPEVERARVSAQRDLLSRIHDEALTGGRGALGRDDCETTGAEGRIAVLLVDPSLEGAASLVERAQATDARVLIAAGEALDELRPLGGVAALLRW